MFVVGLGRRPQRTQKRRRDDGINESLFRFDRDGLPQTHPVPPLTWHPFLLHNVRRGIRYK